MTLDDRLENWGACLRSGKVAGRAQSFEGRSRSTRGNEKEYENGWPTPTRWVIRDTPDAAVIEHAVCALDVYHHAILRAVFVQRAEPWRCLKIARRAADWERVGLARFYPRQGLANFANSLTVAKTLLLGQLDLPAVVRRDRVIRWVRDVLQTGLDFAVAAD